MKKRKVLTGVLIASACLLTIGLVGQLSQNNGWFDDLGKENVEDEYIEYKFKIVDPSYNETNSTLGFEFDSSFDENSVSFDPEEIKYCTASATIDLSVINQKNNYYKTNPLFVANDSFYNFSFKVEDFTVIVCFENDGDNATDMYFKGENLNLMGSVLENTEWTLRLYK